MVFPDHNGNPYALREASGTYGLTAKQIGRKRGGKITIRYGFDTKFAKRSDQHPTFEIHNTIYGPNGHDIGMSIDMVYKVRPKWNCMINGCAGCPDEDDEDGEE